MIMFPKLILQLDTDYIMDIFLELSEVCCIDFINLTQKMSEHHLINILRDILRVIELVFPNRISMKKMSHKGIICD